LGSTVGDLNTSWNTTRGKGITGIDTGSQTLNVSGSTGLTPNLGVGGIICMGQTVSNNWETSTSSSGGLDGDVTRNTDKRDTGGITINGLG
jgi:hypothetical protein